MNEHQKRLLKQMINLINQYRKGQVKYSNFVGELEGALDAGEFKDNEMIEKWYDLWTNLEIMNALKGNEVRLGGVSFFV
ncbi:MAG TPA: hypothetical protein ENJ28_05740 [Gammaproteobacteria bacterium]|nr:hypothetical protein [Gammaproteobacteria bacterium]